MVLGLQQIYMTVNFVGWTLSLTILAAGALESGRTDTPLGVAVHAAAPIQAGRLAAPTWQRELKQQN